MLCAFRFVISWQYDNSTSHNSWLEPKSPPNTPRFKKILDSFSPVGSGGKAHPMAIVHHLLIAANAVVIAGGSIVAGTDLETFNKNMPTAKGLRAAGQAMFLTINVFLLFCIFNVIQQSKREHPEKRIHPTLIILLATWPFLFVRGLYGLLSALVPTFNYFNPINYGDTGLTSSFVISEYILSTTMEWTSCALLMATYITSRNDPKVAPSDMFDSKQVGEGEM
jgi:membrane-associated HD superfamily phosphohydrolase